MILARATESISGVAAILGHRPEVAGALGSLRAALQAGTLPPATDHLSIDDTAYDDLRRHFTEDELVELGVHCAHAVGMGRLTATWDVTDDVPDAFRSMSDSPLAPWISAGVVTSG